MNIQLFYNQLDWTSESALLWPRQGDITNKTLYINVTIFLPVTIYSNELQRNLTESELSFHAAQKRAGPAILAGLEEGVRRGGAVGGAGEGREVKFTISLRDTLCDSTYATKASSPVYTLIRRRDYTDVVSDNFETFQAFIDALPLSARSVLFGPFCELALAPVARQLKVRSHSKLFLLHAETLPRLYAFGLFCHK